jgi:hypothetical protein
MFDLNYYLPARRRQTSSGWLSFNAVCCHHNGHSVDRRGRGGIKFDNQNWIYSCFNCRYTANFTLGKPLSFRARMLLNWLSVPKEEIERINLESLKHKNIFGILEQRNTARPLINFNKVDLPDGVELVSPENTTQWQYLRSRAVPADIPILSVIDEKQHKWRPNVIVPFTHDGNVVGWTARMLDDRRPKYLSNFQPGYVFGCDYVDAKWNWVIVVEGIFDALSIGGLAVMHNKINDQQVQYIKSLGKSVIYVPDYDKTGMEMVDRARELGWTVSMPNWHNEVKDVNDAVIKYGRLGALSLIMQSRETSRIKIEMSRKNIIKRLKLS